MNVGRPLIFISFHRIYFLLILLAKVFSSVSLDIGKELNLDRLDLKLVLMTLHVCFFTMDSNRVFDYPGARRIYSLFDLVTIMKVSTFCLWEAMLVTLV